MARAREATGGAILNGGGKICVGRKREQRERERKKRARALSLSRLLAHVRGTWRGGGRAEEKWAKGREFGPRELEGGDLDFCRDLIWGWFEIRDSNRISDLEIEIWIGREIEIRDWHRL